MGSRKWLREDKARRAEKRRLNRLERIERKRATREKKKITKHHNIAKSLGGSLSPDNIFMLSWEHHQNFHQLFGNRTLKEAAKILLRMDAFHAYNCTICK